MWRLWVGLGTLVWIITIVASGAMNFLFGFDLGRTPNEGMVFAFVGVAADAWKAIGPIFLLCGEQFIDARIIVLIVGSSPRVRGTER